MQSTNVFKTLSKYGSREEENYLTEALVLIIRILVERQPNDGLKFLNNLCGLSERIEHESLPSISISTQVAVDEGRLDIEIKSGSAMLTYIPYSARKYCKFWLNSSSIKGLDEI